MVIGIDARMYNSSGIGRYTRNLIKQLEIQDLNNDFIIFLQSKDKDTYKPRNKRFKKWLVDVPLYSFKEQTNFLSELLAANLDVFYSPNFNVPILYPKKTILTVHDFTMLEGNSEASSLSPSLYSAKSFMGQLVFNISCRKAYKIIVPSNDVKAKLIDRLKSIKDSKIEVIYEGLDEDLTSYAPKDRLVLKTRLEEMKIKDRYILYVGNSYPHKNLKNLIVAYKDLIESNNFEGNLVIAGKIDEFANRLAGFVHALKLDEKIIFVSKYVEEGRLSDRDLAYLYKGALVYVMPSLKEGFSITPLEAQSFGVPVVLSDIPVHKEIYKDSALYFNPDSNIEMSQKLINAMYNKEIRNKLIEEGMKNTKLYSWADLGRGFTSIIKSIGLDKK